MTRLHRAFDYIWKLPVCGLAFSIASIATAAILSIVGLKVPAMPPGVDEQQSALISIALSPLLALGLAPLALRLSGRYLVRGLALAFLAFINLGVNTTIESAIFSTIFAKGGEAFLVLMYLGASVAFGAALARFFGPAAAAPPITPHRTTLSWAGRVVIAVVAFPMIYFVFGWAIGPIVVEQYRAGVAGLVLPDMSVILPTQVLRSVLFLLASAPLIFLWTGTRRALILSLGWAHAVTVGLYGLLSAYWFPAVLRVTHSLEITADSFAYAFVIVMLLKPRAGKTNRATQATGPLASTTVA